jgi:hypothetical protein
MSGGPKSKGSRASIKNPTYPRETHKPKKKGQFKITQMIALPLRKNPNLCYIMQHMSTKLGI